MYFNCEFNIHNNVLFVLSRLLKQVTIWRSQMWSQPRRVVTFTVWCVVNSSPHHTVWSSTCSSIQGNTATTVTTAEEGSSRRAILRNTWEFMKDWNIAVNIAPSHLWRGKSISIIYQSTQGITDLNVRNVEKVLMKSLCLKNTEIIVV